MCDNTCDTLGNEKGIDTCVMLTSTPATVVSAQLIPSDTRVYLNLNQIKIIFEFNITVTS